MNALGKLLAQQREVNEVVFDQKDYAQTVKIDDKAVETRIHGTSSEFRHTGDGPRAVFDAFPSRA